MSAARVQVATAHCSVFGSVVQDVVGTLFRPGRHTLQSLSRALSKGAMVKESLIVLLQHNLIKATETEDGTVFYDVNVQDLLWRGRIPRYLQVVERKFDQLGAEIIEFLFSHGRARLSHIRRGLLGADSQSDLALQRKFTELLDARLVVRMIVYSSEDDRSLITEADLYSLPAECRALFLSDAGVKRKRRDSNEPQLADEENDDATIYWRVNVDAINRLLRNEVPSNDIDLHFELEEAKCSSFSSSRLITMFSLSHTQTHIHSLILGSGSLNVSQVVSISALLKSHSSSSTWPPRNLQRTPGLCPTSSSPTSSKELWLPA
eukprot:m.92770 g.92770  ORF g.92770 m.92770 type:complete len:320 (+) comp51176_c0_seq1:26-985(+)